MARLSWDGPEGYWQETDFTPITMPFTIESLKSLLEHGLEVESRYTHQQIADWCCRFWWEREEGSLSDIDGPALDIAAGVAQDVDAYWGIYLTDEYSFGELKSMDFSKVVLPREWFEEWQNRLTTNEI